MRYEIPANKYQWVPMNIPPEVSKTAEATAIALGHANTTYQECSSLLANFHSVRTVLWSIWGSKDSDTITQSWTLHAAT